MLRNFAKFVIRRTKADGGGGAQCSKVVRGARQCEAKSTPKTFDRQVRAGLSSSENRGSGSVTSRDEKKIEIFRFVTMDRTCDDLLREWQLEVLIDRFKGMYRMYIVTTMCENPALRNYGA